jgi:hypothetical protein
MNYHAELRRLGATPGQPYSRADAWGFSGAIGTAYALPDGSEFRQGRVNIRNGRPRRYARLVLADGSDRHNGLALAYLKALPTPPALLAAREAIRLASALDEADEAPYYVQGRLF